MASAASQVIIEQEPVRIFNAIPDEELSGPGIEYFRCGLHAIQPGRPPTAFGLDILSATDEVIRRGEDELQRR